LRLIGGKHHAKRGQHHIECPVRERQVFGIALAERHWEALGGCTFPSPLQQSRDVVHANDVTVAAGGGERGIPTASCHIEDLLPSTQIDRFAEQLTDDDLADANHREIPCSPHLLLALFERGKI
jgi:hypothetical protein